MFQFLNYKINMYIFDKYKIIHKITKRDCRVGPVDLKSQEPTYMPHEYRGMIIIRGGCVLEMGITIASGIAKKVLLMIPGLIERSCLKE